MTTRDHGLPPTGRLSELVALVGTEVGTSDWKLIDQAMIDQFAELTGDGGLIHNEPEEAARVSPFGGTIVQGFMMLSHLSGFARSLQLPEEGVAFRLNYGFDKVRILNPVPVNSRIRGRFTVAGLKDRGPNGALLTLNAAVEIDGDVKPALVAEWLAFLQLGEA